MESDIFNCIAAAAASYYQSPDRAVMTQHSWLHDFSGCVLMISCDVKSRKGWLHYYYYVRCILYSCYNQAMFYVVIPFCYHNTLEFPCSVWKERHPPPTGTMSCQSAYTIIILLMAVPLKNAGSSSASMDNRLQLELCWAHTRCTHSGVARSGPSRARPDQFCFSNAYYLTVDLVSHSILLE